ncbi:MAG: DUF948 domain-containing protein [Chloroflexota bacterium]
MSLFLFVIGVCAVLVALALIVALLRLARTLAAMEELLLTANDEMQETLPQVRGSLGNVNQITAGVNVALQSAGTGASKVGDRMSAGWYGIKVGMRSLLGGDGNE